MGFLAVLQGIEIGKIERCPELHPGFLADPRKVPVVESAQGRGDNCRPGIVDELADAAVSLSQHTILIPGPLGKKHDFFTFQQIVDGFAGSDIAPPFDGKGTPGAEQPAEKEVVEQFLLGGRPEHLKGVTPHHRPGEEDGVIAGNVVGCQQNAAAAGNVLRAANFEAVDHRRIKADYIGGEVGPDPAEKKCFQGNLGEGGFNFLDLIPFPGSGWQSLTFFGFGLGQLRTERVSYTQGDQR